MSRNITNQPPIPGHIHIDRMRISGPLEHVPLGEVFYRDSPLEDDTVIAAGASALRPSKRGNPSDVYVRSKDVQPDGKAYKLEIDCCPPMLLQRHNFFGHADLIDYCYRIFDQVTREQGLVVDPQQRELWRTGRYVDLTEIHLTGNFWFPPSAKAATFDAIDEDNKTGKFRPIHSCITLGFTPVRRSLYQTLTIYDKFILLAAQWLTPGPLQTKILELACRSLRVELKLFSQGLKRRKLDTVQSWEGLDVDALFFELLEKFNVKNAIQPLLTEEEQKQLTRGAKRAYFLWLSGESLLNHFSRTTVWKYATEVFAKTKIDMGGSRRPEALPAIDLAEVLTPANLVAVPSWAIGTHCYVPPLAR
jgi:hypothetical protein